jgi:hypothetical protein
MQETVTGGDVYLAPLSLCVLASTHRGGAGTYTVEEIYGVPNEESSSFPGPWTYIKLLLVSPWVEGAPSAPIVRLKGGPRADGTSVASAVDLKLGETVGLVMYEATPENMGFPSLCPLGVFRQTKSGEWSNGQVTVDAQGTAFAPAAMDSVADCPDVVGEDPGGVGDASASQHIGTFAGEDGE